MFRSIRRRIFPRSPAKTMVAMLHSARCGSTVLGNMLNAHPKVDWANEIYLKYMNIEKASHPRDLLATELLKHHAMTSGKVFGFEIKYLSVQHLSERCLNMSLTDCVSRLNGLGVTHYIGMYRKNYLRQTISLKVASKKGYWHTKENEPPQAIHLETGKTLFAKAGMGLVEWFDYLDQSYEELKRCLPENSLLLTYEDDIRDDPDVGYHKICHFLGIKPRDPEITIKRTNPFTYEEMVSNLDEVTAKLEDTRHKWMLRD